MASNDMAAVELTKDEQRLLVWGLQVWQGASNPPLLMQRALGFQSDAEMFPWTNQKVHEIGSVTELTRSEWTQLITMVEVGFASDNAGAGLDWSPISGISDADSIRILRGIQRKLAHVVLRGQQT